MLGGRGGTGVFELGRRRNSITEMCFHGFQAGGLCESIRAVERSDTCRRAGGFAPSLRNLTQAVHIPGSERARTALPVRHSRPPHLPSAFPGKGPAASAISYRVSAVRTRAQLLLCAGLHIAPGSHAEIGPWTYRFHPFFYSRAVASELSVWPFPCRERTSARICLALLLPE